jgi:ATP-dependent RNA helicase DDX51/DBP6
VEKAKIGSLVSHEDDGIIARPRKRQKFGSRDTSPSPSYAAATDLSDPSSPVPSSPVQSPAEPPPQSPGRRSPTSTPPPSSLPLFPLPSRPDAPEKSELASQGLDRALARAQLVDPSLSTPLSFDEDDDANTGLSVRMLRRLRDLGITELFAGTCHVDAPTNQELNRTPLVQTTLLPMLLPSEPLKRSLYLPYDSPSDICVSAPTGSGKTLAYVLPIVEVRALRALKILEE